MARQNLIIALDKTRHAYDVTVYNMANKEERVLEVHANNRNQAAKAVRDHGFTSPAFVVLSVNMTG